MKTIALAALLFCFACASAETCTTDPTDVYTNYQDAFYSMESFDDESILKYMTESARTKVKTSMSKAKSQIHGGLPDSDSAIKFNISATPEMREKGALALIKFFRGDKTPPTLQPKIKKTEKFATLIYRWQSDVSTTLTDGVTSKSKTDHEVVIKMVCEGNWLIEQEQLSTTKTHEDYNQKGKRVGQGHERRRSTFPELK